MSGEAVTVSSVLKLAADINAALGRTCVVAKRDSEGLWEISINGDKVTMPSFKTWALLRGMLHGASDKGSTK